MKNNFLTIPDAPNYEINSDLICRNKSTGRILTLHSDYKNFQYYSLYPSCSKITIKRSPETIYAQAFDAVNHSNKFLPITSLNGKYEINTKGIVRNSKSKIILNPLRGTISFHLGNRVYLRRSVSDLLWEVHGIIRQRRFRPCICSAENDKEIFLCRNLTQLASILSGKIFYQATTIRNHLTKRETIIGCYHISYHPNADLDFLANNLRHQAFSKKKIGAISRKEVIKND